MWKTGITSAALASRLVAPRPTWRVAENVKKILDLLDRFRCKATFFMLGSVAESLPELAPLIAAKGHEIASHGYSHTLLSDMDRQQFSDELLRTGQILFEQTGRRPVGYRAPQWSVSPRTPWVDDTLTEHGYLYDSSRTPLPVVGRSVRTAPSLSDSHCQRTALGDSAHGYPC